MQEFDYAGKSKRLRGLNDSDHEPDHLQGYTNLDLVIDEQLKKGG